VKRKVSAASGNYSPDHEHGGWVPAYELVKKYLNFRANCDSMEM